MNAGRLLFGTRLRTARSYQVSARSYPGQQPGPAFMFLTKIKTERNCSHITALPIKNDPFPLQPLPAGCDHHN